MYRTKISTCLIYYQFCIYWQNIAGFKNQLADWWFNSTKELKKQRQRIFSYSFDPSGDLLSESYFIATKLETEGFVLDHRYL